MGIDNMHLSIFNQHLQGRGDDGGDGRKILEGSRKNNNVKSFLHHGLRTKVPASKLQVFLESKHPGSLFQFWSVDIEAEHLSIFYACEFMRKPSIATTNFQNAKRPFFPF